MTTSRSKHLILIKEEQILGSAVRVTNSLLTEERHSVLLKSIAMDFKMKKLDGPA
tara:strand:- start:263 stop:427 length:165 start_codon:yes stop_codon:yes gene_type:complete